MKLNVKFSHIERADSEPAKPESDSPQETPAQKVIDPDSAKKPDEKQEQAAGKNPAGETTRLSLDDLKKQHTRRSAGGMILAGIVFLILVAVAVYFLILRGSPSQGTPVNQYTSFTPSSYLENPTSLAGNRYQTQMRVESQLGSSEQTGRLLVFREQNTQKQLVVLVPADLNRVNLEKGQLLLVKFVIKDGGLIYVEDIQKP